MTLRLILTRHAKSSWDDPLMSDHDRPLNRRGRASADAIGRWMAREGLSPDQALVSSAERTRETWEMISKAASLDVEGEVSPSLYLAEPDVILNVLRGATGNCVMIVAHNPGMAYMAQSIVQAPPAQHLFDRYPTGATTIVDFDVESWDDVIWRAGQFVDFIVPRNLITDEEEAANAAPQPLSA